jgi:hypothetical protein
MFYVLEHAMTQLEIRSRNNVLGNMLLTYLEVTLPSPALSDVILHFMTIANTNRMRDPHPDVPTCGSDCVLKNHNL